MQIWRIYFDDLTQKMSFKKKNPKISPLGKISPVKKSLF
jgi:hypothetical protein